MGDATHKTRVSTHVEGQQATPKKQLHRTHGMSLSPPALSAAHTARARTHTHTHTHTHTCPHSTNLERLKVDLLVCWLRQPARGVFCRTAAVRRAVGPVKFLRLGYGLLVGLPRACDAHLIQGSGLRVQACAHRRVPTSAWCQYCKNHPAPTQLWRANLSSSVMYNYDGGKK